MLADSDLNFHKKLTRFEYSRLYFHDSKFSHEIHENIVPRKFRTIRYHYYMTKNLNRTVDTFLMLFIKYDDVNNFVNLDIIIFSCKTFLHWYIILLL